MEYVCIRKVLYVKMNDYDYAWNEYMIKLMSCTCITWSKADNLLTLATHL